ncbi:MAG: flagellar protein FlaB [Desulfobacula sp. RIFOXYA12_FULL_46_16]|nr:MAG: flagellar protein FlaB [Desulfobacula sp. RIFOXYA12_FULL_46_16]
MALRINTNIAAMNAHKNMMKTDNNLSDSLGRLSTGLRITKAADDASGMAIADSLRSQALGLGQAIRNGNDGIAIVQTADAALEESINIVNTIKQKSIQSAQDGQTTESRKAIQSDITKLRDELDTIAKTTAFNNQKLLSGNFTDRKFQIGAYAGETIGISIQSTEATKIGHITTSDLTFAGEGTSQLNIYSNLQDKTYSLSSVELAYNNKAENGVGAVADSINKLSDVLGISATASVSSSTDASIEAGTTDAGFAINGVTIGALNVKDNDADGALVAAINNKTSEHGVTASVDENGILSMTTADNRAIQVTMGSVTQAVMGGTEDMSTLGKIEVRQEGTSQISITDASAQAGIAFSSADGLTKMAAITATTQEMVLASGSLLTAATTLASGAVLQGSFKTSAAITGFVDNSNVIGAGSIIQSGSVIGSGTTLQGEFKIASMVASTTKSTLAAGSVLTGGATTIISSGSIFEGDVSASLSGTTAGAVVVSGGNTYVKAGAQADIKATGLTLTAGAILGIGSVLIDNTVLAAGSKMGSDITMDAGRTTTVTADMQLNGGATNLAAASIFKSGTTFANETMVGSGSISGGSVTLGTGSVIGANSSLANGSSIGTTGIATVEDETVSADKDMLLAKGSVIAAGSTLTAGTVLTNDIQAGGTTGNQKFAKGTTLEYDIITGTNVALAEDMVINGGSILKAGTTLGVNAVAADDTVDSAVSEGKAYRLSDVDVTTQEGAQIGIAVADAALKSLDKVRSDLGSVQNQLTSTINNISTTRVNVSAAESTIRDVDFSEESAVFTKLQILSQAGTFAMSQANASAQGVLSLLQ